MKKQVSEGILTFDMKERAKKRLGELLIEDGIITRENLEEALTYQKKEGGLIGQILIRLGYISEENLAAALGYQLQIPYLPLMNYSVNADAAKRFDEDFCRRNMAMVFDHDEKKIFLTVSDPLNETILEEVEKKAGLKVHLFLSTPSEIMNMLDLIFKSVKKPEVKKAA